MENLKCNVCGKCSEYLVDTEFYKYFSEDKRLKGLSGHICNKCIAKFSKLKKLYRVSFKADKTKKFCPQIPKHRHIDEDSITNRICLSSSIEGCLSASPYGGEFLEEILWGNSSFLVRVYEFNVENINIKNIIPPEYLYQQDLVRDAHINNEYWIVNQNLTPSRSYFIKILHYNTTYPDDISYEDYIKGFKLEEKGDGVFEWSDIISGHLIAIYGVEYEIVPEERLIDCFELNHNIIGVSEKNISRIEECIQKYMFRNMYNKVKIEKVSEDNFVIKGKIHIEKTEALDCKDVIPFINYHLGKGKIIEK